MIPTALSEFDQTGERNSVSDVLNGCESGEHSNLKRVWYMGLCPGLPNRRRGFDFLNPLHFEQGIRSTVGRETLNLSTWVRLLHPLPHPCRLIGKTPGSEPGD